MNTIILYRIISFCTEKESFSAVGSFLLHLFFFFFVPGGKKQTINSWKRYALCDSVLCYERIVWEFEYVKKNSMGREIWSICHDKYCKIWTFYT